MLKIRKKTKRREEFYICKQLHVHRVFRLRIPLSKIVVDIYEILSLLHHYINVKF